MKTRSISLLVLGALSSITLIATSQPPAQAFIKIKPPKISLPKIKIPSQIDASISVRNESGKAIRVVMDNNRETHVIAAGGRVTFKKANVGDAPTFNVYDAATGEALYGKKMNPVGLKSSIGWNGNSM